jgi:hypothetical protein
MPRLVAAHLIMSVLFLSVGIGLGIHMGVAHDFTLAPVHAHINLLGWVTNAIIALVFWLSRRSAGRLGWAIFASFNLGTALKCAGLATALSGAPVPGVLLAGVVLVSLGVILFAVHILRAARRSNA